MPLYAKRKRTGYGSTRRTYGRRVYRKTTPYRKKPVKRVAYRALSLARSINSKIEVKTHQTNPFDGKLIHGGGLSLQGNLQSEYGAILPNVVATAASVVQGTGPGQRVGQRIAVKSLKLDMMIHARPHVDGTPSPTNDVNPSISPFEVHMIVYRNKHDKMQGNPAEILMDLSNHPTAINGSATRNMFAWNRGLFSIYKHKVFKFKAQPTGRHEAAISGQDALVTETGTTNSPQASFYQKFSCYLPVKKMLNYVHGSTAPVNDGLSVGFYTINGNATGHPTQWGESRALIYANTTLRYTDA